ncbi:MAG: glycosyltransferase family 2 protein [Sediminibacterium sp.]|jgi:glycosyltransferase involved in cell wall biosynthesis
MNSPLISICIPAYKKPEYVLRCIQSIQKQTYKAVEIIISDDSPNQDMNVAINSYTSELNIHYYHNSPALKSPANWNNAINKATGDYYILMHQDDWFNSPDALQIYLNTFLNNPTVNFVFCRNTAIQPDGEIITLQAIPSLLKEMSQKPNHILRANVIGPPSNVMLKAGIDVRYEEKYIWLVDVDYYVQLLNKGYRYVYLDQHLVSIGLHEDQTTVYCRNNEDVIVRENIHFATKIGNGAFKDILIFDYYWRLLRNYKIRSIQALVQMGVNELDILPVIKKMLAFQTRFSFSFLKIGIVSKMLMMYNYLGRPSN